MVVVLVLPVADDDLCVQQRVEAVDVESGWRDLAQTSIIETGPMSPEIGLRDRAERARRTTDKRHDAGVAPQPPGSPPFRCPSKTAASKLTGALTHDRGCFD